MIYSKKNKELLNDLILFINNSDEIMRHFTVSWAYQNWPLRKEKQLSIEDIQYYFTALVNEKFAKQGTSFVTISRRYLADLLEERDNMYFEMKNNNESNEINDSIFNDLRKLLTKDISKTIKRLKLILNENSDRYDEVINYEGQFNQTLKDFNLNILSRDLFELSTNKVRNSLLYLIRELETNDLNEILERENINEITKNNLDNYGFSRVITRKPYELLDKKYSMAKKRIYILQTWLEASNPIPQALANAARSGVEVKILILNPDSIFAKDRTINLGYEQNSTRPNSLFDGLIASIKKRIGEKSNFQLGIYDHLPPFPMYLIDNWIAIGQYWYDEGSITNYHFEVTIQAGGIGELYLNTFESIWNNADKEYIYKYLN